MTSFADLQFLFRFFPVVFLLYYLVPVRWRSAVLVVASLVFYACGDLRFLPLLIALMLLNYGISGRVAAHSRIGLVMAVTVDVMTLALFKGMAALGGSALLPMGLSFYSFRMIAYQADLYTGRVMKRPSFLQTCLYFCLFTQLISGPIARIRDWQDLYAFSDEEEELPEPERLMACLRRLERGLTWFIPGLAMKVLLADHLAMCWNEIGTIGYESISTPLAWLGTVVYSLDLYFDFWGYSLMAAGMSVALGFPFIRNFEHPYAAGGVSDFYRRWHMTLGTWFRDMVYIPLGGSRSGSFNTVVNLLIVWLLTALWHGITPNFLIWGMALYLMIVSEKFIIGRWPRVKAVIGRIHVLLCIPLTWIVFAVTDTGELAAYFRRLFAVDQGIAVNPGDITRVGAPYIWFVAVGVLLLIPAIARLYDRYKDRVVVKLMDLALFWVSVYSVTMQSGNPFMYFSF